MKNKDDYTIEELVDLAESKGDIWDISELAVSLYNLDNEKGLDLMIKLALCNYGGVTFKSEFQRIGYLGVLHWGVNGVKKLAKKVIESGDFRASDHMIYLLSQISSKNLNYTSYSRNDLECVQKLDISSEKYQSKEWIMAAKEILVDLVKNVEQDENFPTGIISNLGFGNNEIAKEHVFAALIARWFNFNSNGLEKYLNLVNAENKDEIDYQNFLKSNPYILEPFHAQIWSKPRFGEEYVPDFLIRSMDNSYTVVEIEKTDLPIMTSAGELSSKTTHAKRQAFDYRDWVISNRLYANQRFKDIHNPYCLVVIGRESDLNEMQLNRLRQENESTQGILKIVGFDWLYKRAKMTFNNILEFGFNKDTFRETIDE